MTILFRATPKLNTLAFDQKMIIRRSDVDEAGLNQLTAFGVNGDEMAFPAQDLWQFGPMPGRHVDDDEYRDAERGRQSHNHLSYGGKAPGGRSDDNNVPLHWNRVGTKGAEPSIARGSARS